MPAILLKVALDSKSNVSTQSMIALASSFDMPEPMPRLNLSCTYLLRSMACLAYRNASTAASWSVYVSFALASLKKPEMTSKVLY